MLGYPPLDDQEQEEEGQNPLERILFQGNSRSYLSLTVSLSLSLSLSFDISFSLSLVIAAAR
jgi:hypothetical protein